MRIDRLTLQNFRRFADLTLDLHPQFTLLVGNNGSGKTTILDALAISLTPAMRGDNEARKIEVEDGRLIAKKAGDRVQFEEQFPVVVKALGQIGARASLEWEYARTPKFRSHFPSDAQLAVDQLQGGDQSNEPSDWPVIAYYGVTRSSLPPDWLDQPIGLGLARREDAYRNWLNGHISYHNLKEWFYREIAWAGVNGGNKRPGYEVVRQAVFDCLPGADDLWLDVDRNDLICSIGGQAQPLSNLSEGQRVLLAMVADIAIKAVTLNAHLLPADADKLGKKEEPTPRVLRQTPGVVLIDELDIHLHPSWQRHVAADLKRTFPAIQFICTSHSPQVIGELKREEIRLLRPEGIAGPSVAKGADSNWILDHVMVDSASENLTVRQLKVEAEDALAVGDLSQARIKLAELRQVLDGDTGDLVRLESSLSALEVLMHEGETV